MSPRFEEWWKEEGHKLGVSQEHALLIWRAAHGITPEGKKPLRPQVQHSRPLAGWCIAFGCFAQAKGEPSPCEGTDRCPPVRLEHEAAELAMALWGIEEMFVDPRYGIAMSVHALIRQRLRWPLPGTPITVPVVTDAEYLAWKGIKRVRGQGGSE